MVAVALASEGVGSDLKRRRLLEIIKEKSLLKGEEFVLASGRTSNYYFIMKKTTMDPEGSNLVADWILDFMEGKGFKAIGGIVMGAVPIVSVVCAKSYYREEPYSGFFVRNEAKKHGTKERVDGQLPPKMRVLVVDDVTTTGGSVLKAVQAAREEGCIVDTVVTIVDREEGAAENLKAAEIELVPIFISSDFD